MNLCYSITSSTIKVDIFNIHMIKRFFIVTVGLMVTILAVPAVVSASSDSGANSVLVDSCRDVSDGIMVRRFGNRTEYKLANGVRDAGHGLREYTLYCTSRTKYFVSWKTPQAQEPVQPPTPVQPQINLIQGYKSTWNGNVSTKLFSETKSYRDRNLYPPLGYPVEIKNDVDWVKAMGWLVNGNSSGNMTYGLSWKYSKNNDLVFDRYTAQSLTAWAHTSSKPSFIAPVLDNYRDGYVLVLVYVRNNDGISAVPNMNVEVDDIMPLYFHLEAKEQTMSCGNSYDGDGLFSTCIGDMITHDSGLTITTKIIKDSYIQVVLDKGNYNVRHILYLNKPKIINVDGTTYRLTYTLKSDIHGAFISVEQVNTAPTMLCGNSSGSDGLYNACVGDTIAHTSGLDVFMQKINDNYVIARLNKDSYSVRHVLRLNKRKIVNINGTTYRLTYTSKSDVYGAFVKVEQVSVPVDVITVKWPTSIYSLVIGTDVNIAWDINNSEFNNKPVFISLARENGVFVQNIGYVSSADILHYRWHVMLNPWEKPGTYRIKLATVDGFSTLSQPFSIVSPTIIY